MQVVEPLDEQQVRDLLHHLQRIGYTSRPEGVPDLVDLAFDVTSNPIAICSAPNGALSIFIYLVTSEQACRLSATPNRLGRVIADAGCVSRIVVKRLAKRSGEKIKYASSHDLRRTFATNLQRDLTIPEQQKLTRHADAKTLLDHYSDAPTPVVIAKLRGKTTA